VWCVYSCPHIPYSGKRNARTNCECDLVLESIIQFYATRDMLKNYFFKNRHRKVHKISPASDQTYSILRGQTLPDISNTSCRSTVLITPQTLPYSSRQIFKHHQQNIIQAVKKPWRNWPSGSRRIPKKRYPTIPPETLELALISTTRIAWRLPHVRVWLLFTVNTTSHRKHTSPVHRTLSTVNRSVLYSYLFAKFHP